MMKIESQVSLMRIFDNITEIVRDIIKRQLQFFGKCR